MTADDTDVLVGKVLGAHGVNGVLKVYPYTESPAMLARYPLRLASETLPSHLPMPVTLVAVRPRDVLLRHPLVPTRTLADAVRGAALYTLRSALPPLEETAQYQNDLLGARVNDENGLSLGTLCGFHDFGAGLVADIQPIDHTASTRLIPYDCLMPDGDRCFRLQQETWKMFGA
jgi:16S rRNA processing protein RimM